MTAALANWFIFDANHKLVATVSSPEKMRAVVHNFPGLYALSKFDMRRLGRKAA